MSDLFFSSIEESDQFLEEWITTVSKTDSISFSSPITALPEDVINAYLYSITPAPMRDSLPETPIRVTLNYLITVWHNDLSNARRILDNLIFEALINHSLNAKFPTPQELAVLNIPIIPCFQVSLTIAKKLSLPEAKFVKKPLVIKPAFVTRISGHCFDKNGKPRKSVQISIPQISYYTSTSEDGSFKITQTPGFSNISELVSSLVFQINDRKVKVKKVEETEYKGTVKLKVTLEV
ncbi:hypothetical protein QA601_03370 [Chitinispirillales bacterium ANBcel5]|uniref:hypothetical protein n=1 Tax=Cellulosispirillum alkaliphilum TaxID=3039283 RepID=UPI002A5576E9|nr:hypothetical protein [Chitinispirillales bacterium ANBcel5]